MSSFIGMVSQFSFQLGILCQAVVRERGCKSHFQVGVAHGKSSIPFISDIPASMNFFLAF